MREEMRSKIRLVGVACLSAMVAFALTACGGSQQSTSTSNEAQKPAETATTAEKTVEQVAVPNVKKMERAKAVKALENAGFMVGDVEKGNSDTIAAGRIISQDPKAGVVLEKGSEVSLVVSVGKKVETAKVPDVFKKGRAEAEKALKAAGFESVYAGQAESLKVTPGLVVRQLPKAGTVAAKGDKVKFFVAKYPSKVVVPTLTKRTLDDATSIAKKYTLKVSHTTKHSSSVKKGLVISQDPKTGREAAGGSTVKLVISSGPDEAAAKKSSESKTSEKSNANSSSKKSNENSNSKKSNEQSSSKQETKKVQVTVPKVVNLTWKDAKRNLEAKGLVVKRKGAEAGLVDKQSIAAGKKVNKGATITLTVVEAIEMPDVTGESFSMAFDTLYGLGLDVDRNTPPHGTVVGQDPEAGQLVKLGTVVKLEVDTSDFE